MDVLFVCFNKGTLRKGAEHTNYLLLPISPHFQKKKKVEKKGGTNLKNIISYQRLTLFAMNCVYRLNWIKSGQL